MKRFVHCIYRGRVFINLRATKIYADTLLDVHNEIVERHLANARKLTRPCLRLNEAFNDAYILLSNTGTILQSLEHIPALDADIFKSFLIAIMQLNRLIGALEVLVDFLSIITAVKSSKVTFRGNVDDVTFNGPGQLLRQGSEQSLLSAAVVQEDTIDNVPRLVLMTQNEELERELRGLRFLLCIMRSS
ncbi:hypothetical protein BC827DRAFT_1371768 [Russula dissimulans]|nr:hypothetical protein BC827DRAFT_1371768 [Russula dissimulans]